MHGMSLHQVRAEQEATGGSGALRSVHEHPDPRDAGGVLQTRCEDEQQDGDGGRGGANPCGALQLDPVLCAMGSIQSSIYGQVGGGRTPRPGGGGSDPPLLYKWRSPVPKFARREPKPPPSDNSRGRMRCNAASRLQEPPWQASQCMQRWVLACATGLVKSLCSLWGLSNVGLLCRIATAMLARWRIK